MTTSGNTTLTQNFIGARGLEAMTTKVGNSTPITSYPLYDVHGNMVATVQKASSGTSWTTQDERSYDVWGSVRSGIATGGPRGRYCANLGHVQDDESGLVYMRARYYEPSSGRFVSQDSARDGHNWYSYCGSDPLNFNDRTGNVRNVLLTQSAAIAFFVYFASRFIANEGQHFERYLASYIIFMAVTVTAATAEDWLYQAAMKAERYMKQVDGEFPETTASKGVRRTLFVSFWTGYMLSIIFLNDYLEAWAEGKAQ